jgi:hypothetical protein
MSSALIASVLSYAAQGRSVFPLHTIKAGMCSCGKPDCDSPGKHPRTAHGLSDATTDETQLREWWTKWPDANVGIRTGGGLVVLDVDRRHDGHGTLSRFPALPPTSRVKTGNGWHHYFFCDGEVPNSTGTETTGLGPGLDVRGDGGYVVAPPSLHHSGAVYGWDDGSLADGFAEVPPWVVNPPSHNGEAHDHVDMAAVLEGVDDGHRDRELFRAACKMRRADIPLETATELIVEAAARCNPPFPAALALQKVNSAYGRYQPEPDDPVVGGVLADVLGHDSVGVVVMTAMGPAEFIFTDLEKVGRPLEGHLALRLLVPGQEIEYRTNISLSSQSNRDSIRREIEAFFGGEKTRVWTKALAQATAEGTRLFFSQTRSMAADPTAHDSAHLSFIVDTLVPDDGITILFGPSEGSKTYHLMSLGLAIARGAPWCGRPTIQRNVLYVDYETGQKTWHYRLGRLQLGLDGSRHEEPGLRYYPANGIPYVDLVESIRVEIATHHIGIILMDHAAVACGGKPEDASSAANYERAQGRLGIPNIVLAHITGEGERDPAQVLRPFGSVFWKGSARRRWFMHPDPDSPHDTRRTGWYSRKASDGARPDDFGTTIRFMPPDPDGPVVIAPGGLSQSVVLTALRGKAWAAWSVLERALSYEDWSKAAGMTQASLRQLVTRNPQMFVTRGESFEKKLVARRETLL